MINIAELLQSLRLEQYLEAFSDNAIDIDVISSLTDSDWDRLGVRLGDRRRIVLALQKRAPSASEDVTGAALTSPATAAVGRVPPTNPTPKKSPSPTEATTPEGERRQLTVMFCDLVGSTALSEKLDPEELRALLHDYRTVCGEVISRYEGFVARYVGDGILTYFGWPKAHEEDAERALRAALEIFKR